MTIQKLSNKFTNSQIQVVRRCHAYCMYANLYKTTRLLKNSIFGCFILGLFIGMLFFRQITIIITWHWFWQPWNCFHGKYDLKIWTSPLPLLSQFLLVCQMPIKTKLQRNRTMFIVSNCISNLHVSKYHIMVCYSLTLSWQE